MEKEHTYHIIRNGVKEEVTATQLNLLTESNERIDGDIEWYLSHGYVTAEDFHNKQLEKLNSGNI